MIPSKFGTFNGLKIELLSMPLSSHSSYEIDYPPIRDENYYSISNDVLGEIVVLQKRKSEITGLVILSTGKHDHIHIVPSLTELFEVEVCSKQHSHEYNNLLKLVDMKKM